MKKCRKRNPCSQRSKRRRWVIPPKDGERECVCELPAPGDGKTGPMQSLWPQIMAAWCLQQREHSALCVCCCFKQDVTSRGLFLFLTPSDSASCLCLLACEGRERKENRARGGNCSPTLSDPSPSPGHVRIYFSTLEVPSTLPPFPLTQLLQLIPAGHTGFPPATRALPPSQTNSGWRQEAIKEDQQGPAHTQTSLRILGPLSLC